MSADIRATAGMQQMFATAEVGREQRSRCPSEDGRLAEQPKR